MTRPPRYPFHGEFGGALPERRPPGPPAPQSPWPTLLALLATCAAIALAVRFGLPLLDGLLH